MTGGNANATGGNGGDADTGNTQKYNGNAYARSESKGKDRKPPKGGESCGCKPHGPGKGPKPHKGQEPCGCDHGSWNDEPRSEATAKGGDTSATSGDAHGGNGGDAKANAGDADVTNGAWVHQVNSLLGGGH